MLTIRQTNILKVIIEDYIVTVEPISSNVLCSRLNVSSATVRNEMASLEKMGFIVKNHFASGRVPTELGYKYYVDNIMNTDNISEDMNTKISNIFENKNLSLKDAIFESVRLINDLTNYSIIMLGSNSKFERLSEVKIVPVASNFVVAIIVTDNGAVYNRHVKMDEDINLSELEYIVSTINSLLIDTPILELNYKLETEIQPKLNIYLKQRSLLCEALIASLANLKNEGEYIVEGRENLFFQPEFDDINKVRDAIRKLNDETILQLLNYTEGISVKIGKENLVLDDLSVITASYSDENEGANIAVIGPQRMNYENVVGVLKAIKDNVDKITKEESSD